MKVSNEETYNDIQWYLGDNNAYEGLHERDCLIWFSTKQKMVNYQLFELRLLQGGRRKWLKSLSYGRVKLVLIMNFWRSTKEKEMKKGEEIDKKYLKLAKKLEIKEKNKKNWGVSVWNEYVWCQIDWGEKHRWLCVVKAFVNQHVYTHFFALQQLYPFFLLHII